MSITCNLQAPISVNAASERSHQSGINTAGKEHFTSLYSCARVRAFIKRNITAARAASGLFLINPDRVLRATPKSPFCSIIPQIHDSKVVARPQANVQSPVTPVLAEALTLLHNVIKEDAYMLNEMNMQRIQRHIQKLANAA